MLFSIITSTYNRGYTIEKLYRSLQRQYFTDFEWIVINDGSTDNTTDLFKKWMNDNNVFHIRYFEQKNLGLIRSLNKAINLAKGDFILKIDSDDYITDDCLSFFANKIKGISGNVYAVGAQKGKSENTPIKGSFPLIDEKKGFVDANDLERNKYNLDTDMCEAWKTTVLRKYPFKVWKNEKFAPEQISFYQIALDGYKIRWFAKVVCIIDYKDDGMTKGASKLVKENPMGYAMMYKQYMEMEKKLIKKCYFSLQIIALSFYAGNWFFFLELNNIIIPFMLLPLGFLLFLRRKSQFSKL